MYTPTVKTTSVINVMSVNNNENVSKGENCLKLENNVVSFNYLYYKLNKVLRAGCSPDGDCTGADAIQKCFDRKTMVTKNGPSTLKWEGARYMLFPKHTCVSSWECNTFSTSVDVFAKIEQSGEIVWVFYTKDNKEMELNKDLIELGLENNLGEKICVNQDYTEPSVHVEEAECYAESILNIKCIVRGHSEFEGVVFDVSQSGDGTLRNLLFEIVGPLMVPDDGRISNVMDNKVQGMPSVPTVLEDRQRSVNVETAHEHAINAIALQMQTLYNILSLAQEVDEIYNALLMIVKSQSIDDPMLISKILKGHRFASRWVNNDVFEKCPCVQDEFPKDSNCGNGKIFSYGSYVQVTDVSECFHTYFLLFLHPSYCKS